MTPMEVHPTLFDEVREPISLLWKESEVVRFPEGFHMSDSVCAMFKSPATMTGSSDARSTCNHSDHASIHASL